MKWKTVWFQTVITLTNTTLELWSSIVAFPVAIFFAGEEEGRFSGVLTLFWGGAGLFISISPSQSLKLI